ncbi:MAG TPA: 23S rRNA (uridine(2552)-2'-O)-methyltransferase RlmE [Burkholderiales bacterium]|jgi:23S rRNA (uridine2552-2'-O)-methyltransferase|nr:23S rRNA (uridine(2552)-2'-O)-methyltransferase RlmE [Burkholderiales bacterium]
MKRTKTSKQWMMEHVNDVYVQRAKAEGYRSRAAYKLIEVAARDKLLKPGMVVVDLGAAPGGWSQVAAAKAGERGRVIAVDLLPMDSLRNVTFLQGDFRDEAVAQALERELAGRPIDLVLSDMSPNISGIALSDQARAMLLAELALEFAVKHLKPGGSLLVKVFQGSGFQEFLREMRSRFMHVMTRKPEASRGRSNELYLLGKERKAGF